MGSSDLGQRRRRSSLSSGYDLNTPFRERFSAAVRAFRTGEPRPPFAPSEIALVAAAPLLAVALAIVMGFWLFSAPARRLGPPPPAADPGRATLVRALDAWHAGKTREMLEADSPSLVVADQDWQRGATLLDYRIVDDGTPYGAARRFEADLTIQVAGVKSTVRGSYLVATRKPNTVMREDE